jgi:hypothetical protein
MFLLQQALGGLRVYTHFDDSDSTEAWRERFVFDYMHLYPCILMSVEQLIHSH